MIKSKRYTRKHGGKKKHKHHKKNKHTRKHNNMVTHGIRGLNTTIKRLVKSITGKPFRGTIGIVSKEVINRTTPFVYKIPIAGNKMVYIFKNGNNGFYMVLTKLDNIVDSAGNLVTTVLDSATDLTVLTIDMVIGKQRR